MHLSAWMYHRRTSGDRKEIRLEFDDSTYNGSNHCYVPLAYPQEVWLSHKSGFQQFQHLQISGVLQLKKQPQICPVTSIMSHESPPVHHKPLHHHQHQCDHYQQQHQKPQQQPHQNSQLQYQEKQFKTANQNLQGVIDGITSRSLTIEKANGAYYTAKEVLAHNSEPNSMHWSTYKKKIYEYDITELLLYFRPWMNESANGTCMKWYRRNPERFVVALGKFVSHLLACGVSEQSIFEALDCFCVGHLRILSPEEWEVDFRKELCNIRDSLLEEESDSEAVQDLLRVFKRRLQCGNYEKENVIFIGEDPNKRAFPLPEDDGLFQPERLRQWCWNDSYEPFETSEEPWEMIQRDSDRLPEPANVFAEWRGDWEPFDFEIDGEAAWVTLPNDVCKNDELTRQQKLIIRSREHRFDLRDPERMARRRKRLAEYFMSKYGWDVSKLKPYEGWAELLTENERKLVELS